jgi:predicted O-linked N-acetylglucosamine transferase (SPINDLY family)
MLALEHARQHLARGQWSQARPLLERAARANPKDPHAAFLLARTLQMLGEREPAAYYAARCVELRPADPSIRIAAAELLQAVGKLADAERLFREGATKFLTIASMHSGLINALRAQGRVGEAGDAALAATATFERDPLLAIIAAGALGESLRPREASALVRRAVSLAPKDHRILRAAATMLLYADDSTDAELASVHAALAHAFAAAHPAQPLAPPPRDSAQPLRVGLVSPDLRDHAVARFLESWIGQHDRALVAIVGIPTLGPADETTQRLRAACDAWVDVSTLGDDAATAAIRGARLDVAIDLGGWHVTARPSLFARRLAPRQLNWLGYAHATALPTIDARLADAMTDPDSLRASCFRPRASAPTETPTLEPTIALDPCFLCFAPDPRTPEIAAKPSHSNDAAIRFASFNSQQKVTPTTLDLWCRVLGEIPQSRLVLKARALTDPSTRLALEAHAQSRGIEPGRIEVLPHAGSYAEHLARYNACDVALDTTPYTGTTTTCEALLMGLPVITVSGTRHAARVGASLLTAAGCPRQIASDADAFTRLAADACRTSDPAARLQAKTARRAALLASPLCDAKAFASRWQAALLALAQSPQ